MARRHKLEEEHMPTRNIPESPTLEYLKTLTAYELVALLPVCPRCGEHGALEDGICSPCKAAVGAEMTGGADDN